MPSARSGRRVKQLEGYVAFEPAPLPPEPPIEMDRSLQRALSRADQEVGRLDGASRFIPDAELFLAMFVRREALLSSQIEGTDCTLDDLFVVEMGHDLGRGDELADLDVREVVNYVAAMDLGLRRLVELPLSNRLLREVHAELLRDGRGSNKEPGRFRRTQNWIGPPGCDLATASYVPPPPHVMNDAMSSLEKFLHQTELPVLVTAGLAHAQFETIHPFLDGNGRTGRLLVGLFLNARGVLSRPVLHLSTYLRRHRARYFDHLTAVRDEGAWEPWLEFFLDGVASTAAEAAVTAQQVQQLRERDRSTLQSVAGTYELQLLDALYRQPLVNATWVQRRLHVAPATANKVLARCEAAGILRETTGGRRNRLFRYDEYLDLFDTPIAPVEDDATHTDVSHAGQ